MAWGPRVAGRASPVCSPSLYCSPSRRPVTLVHLGQTSTLHTLDSPGQAAACQEIQGDPVVFASPDSKRAPLAKHWVGRSEHPVIQLHLCQEPPLPRLTWVMVLCVLCFHCATRQPRGRMRKPPVTQGKDPAGQVTTSSNTELAQPLPAA